MLGLVWTTFIESLYPFNQHGVNEILGLLCDLVGWSQQPCQKQSRLPNVHNHESFKLCYLAYVHPRPDFAFSKLINAP